MDQAEIQSILEQIDRALSKWKGIEERYHDLGDTPTELAAESHALLAATLRRLAPPGSAYLESAAHAFQKAADIYYVPELAGILKAMRADYEAGYLQTIHELIHADVFSDFLEMADHLLEEGYKDPAAVLVGGVLEEHLRKLCEKNGIATESGSKSKKADRMNADLTGVNVYSKLDQKNVTAWLDLRNKAAHGNYDGYQKEQVAIMLQSIRDFLTRVPG